jgi:thiol-disulfide isomerase/thioredoxin
MSISGTGNSAARAARRAARNGAQGFTQNKKILIGLVFLFILAGVGIGIYYGTKESFESNINMNKLTLYHLHGCPHCVSLMPVWNRLKKKYGDNMAEYEANANPNLMNSKGIHSYPTILFGDKHYKGDRSYKDLEKFLLNNLHK